MATNAAIALIVVGYDVAGRRGAVPARASADHAARRLDRRLAVLRPASVRGDVLGRDGSWTLHEARCTAARTTICRASCAGSRPISACTTCITCAAASPTTGFRKCCATTPSWDDRAADAAAELRLRAAGAVGREPPAPDLFPRARRMAAARTLSKGVTGDSVRSTPPRGHDQRPFLSDPPLEPLIPGWLENGETLGPGFGFSAFGFLFSRLPRCSRFAMAGLPCGGWWIVAGDRLSRDRPIVTSAHAHSS